MERRTTARGQWHRPIVGAGLIALAIAVLIVGGWAVDRWRFGVDRSIVLGLRAWGGPWWLPHATRDVTALGGVTVLTLAVIATVVLLLVQRLWLTALATVVACWSVDWVVAATKRWVDRPRPTIVAHLVDVQNASFPSGHAAGSAAVYLTLAALATHAMPDRRSRRAVIAMTAVLVGLIGVSRVYLGVHWPSDVLAGWSFGTLWALGWWQASAALHERGGGPC